MLINIANKYRGSITEQPWLDYAVQIEGASIAEPLQQLCRDIYLKTLDIFPMSVADWLIVIGMSFTSLIIIQISKALKIVRQ